MNLNDCASEDNCNGGLRSPFGTSTERGSRFDRYMQRKVLNVEKIMFNADKKW